jgi:phosphatidylinositol alpha-1,6-mannosyltransferase
MMNELPKVRCLIITSIFPPLNGGSAVVYDNLCRFAPKDSMYVLTCWRNYATGKTIDSWKSVDESCNYPVYRIELIRPLSNHCSSRLQSILSLLHTDIPLKIKILYKTYQIIKAQKINLICIGELNSGSWLGLTCRLLFGCKTINYIHGEEITSTTTYLLYGRFRQFYLKKANAIVAVSQFTRNALIKQMQIDEKKIRVIENGVDIEKFFPGPKNVAILERYKLNNKKILLTVGRLVERKGIDKTLYALPEIIKSIPNIHYVIVGIGEFRPQLDKIVAELQLQNHVTFTNRVPEEDLVKYYQTCDLFIMPNRELADHDTEGFGLVFLEANACKKAVIGGRAGGAVEAVQHNKTGLLVDGNYPEEIAKAVIELITDDKRRQSMEKKGYTVAQNASWKKKAHQFYNFCQQLLQNP